MNFVKLYKLFFHVFFCLISVTLSIQSHCILTLIVDHLRPHTIVIFVNDEITENEERACFFSEIIDKTPAVIVNLGSKNNINESRSLALPIFQNPRQSTVYVIHLIRDDRFKEKIWKILDELVSISPIPTRSKSLLILTIKNGDWSTNDIEKVLNYAWSLKFLHFTIVYKTLGDKVIHTNFNPFTQVYASKCLRTSSQIFPDKLQDVNNYPLIIPVYESKPYLIITETNASLNVHGTDVDYINVISQKMNFNSSYIMQPHINTYELLDLLHLNLEENRISLVPASLTIKLHHFGRKHIIGHVAGMKNVAVLVPIRKISRIRFPFETLLCVLTFPIIILIFLGCARLLKFDPRRWEVFYILGVLIGVVSSFPRRVVENKIFLLMAISSILYSNIFFSLFEEMKVFYEDEAFDSVDDFLKSKMKIYSTHSSQKNDPISIRDLYSKVEKVNISDDCLIKMVKNRGIICIVTEGKAQYFLERNLDKDWMRIFKLSKLSVKEQFSFFPYEKASPFAEKFDKIIQKTTESGILKVKKVPKDETEIHESSEDLKKKEEDVLVQQLLAIMMIGFSLSIIVFTIELKK